MTTTRSIRPMPCAAADAEIVGYAAAREDAAVDLRVQCLDAAVHHLGKPGDVGDADDGKARLRSALAVPPVETSSKPRAASPRANSTSPDLSDTLSSARGMVIRRCITAEISALKSSSPCRLDTTVTALSIGCVRGAFPETLQSRPRKHSRSFFVPRSSSAASGRTRSSGSAVRQGPAQQAGKKNDAYHRQGQVVQQRQGLRIH